MSLRLYGNVRPFYSDPYELYNRLLTIYKDSASCGCCNQVKIIETVNPDSSTRATVAYEFVSREVYHLATIEPDEQTRIRRGHLRGHPLFDLAYIFRSPEKRITHSRYFGILLLRDSTPICTLVVAKDDAPITWRIPSREWSHLSLNMNSDCIVKPAGTALPMTLKNLFKEYDSSLIFGVVESVDEDTGLVRVALPGVTKVMTAKKSMKKGDMITADMVEAAIADIPAPKLVVPKEPKEERYIDFESIDELREKLS